jgi:hypothetical protein
LAGTRGKACRARWPEEGCGDRGKERVGAAALVKA